MLLLNHYVTQVMVFLLPAVAAPADSRASTGAFCGGGVFPANCKPVKTWSETKNVLWKTPLPNLGNGSPICVDKRVFVMCEPGWKSDVPVLVCINADNGRLLWQKPIDPFDTLPEAEQTKARELRARHFDLLRLVNTCNYRAATASPEVLESLKQEAAKQGLEARQRKGKTTFSPKKDVDPFGSLEREYGFARPVWHHGAIGMTFATPVSDGRHVYVSTAYKTVACYDTRGNLKWIRWHRKEPYPKQRNREGPHLTAAFVQSPLIVGNLLVVHANAVVEAYDLLSGRTVWKTVCDWEFRKNGANSSYMVGSPAVVRLQAPDGGGAAECVLVSTGELIRVSDGKVLMLRIGQQGAAAGPVSDGGNTVFITSGSNGGHYIIEPDRTFTELGGHAVRFTMTGKNGVKAEGLWHAKEAGSGAQTGLYYRDVLYVGSQCKAVDPKTGTTLWSDRSMGRADNALVVADGHVFALSSNGKCAVMKLGRPGTVVAVNQLDQIAMLEGEKRDQIISQTGQDKATSWYGWHFSRSVPFFSGNRIFIRSFDYLYCIGE